MKKIRILLCTLVLLLCAGCGTAPDTGTNHAGAVVGSNAPQAEIRELPNAGPVAETPEGYYYANGNIVYFCPKGGSSLVPLCGKPNCQHNNKHCNAYLFLLDALDIYDGALYTMDSPLKSRPDEIYFSKRKLDGSDHSLVATLNTANYGIRGDMGFELKIYQGKAYVLMHENVEGASEQDEHLVVVNLEDGTSTELAESFLREHTLMDMQCFHGKMYGWASEDKDPNADVSKYALIEMDLSTGAITELPIHGRIASYVTETTVYYYDNDWLDYKTERPGFKEYDRETGTIREFETPAGVEGFDYVTYDLDYVYAWSEGDAEKAGKLYILSRDYQLVDQCELKRGEYIISMASDCIFLADPYAERDPVHDMVCSVLCLQKSQFGSHNLSAEKLEFVTPKAEWEDIKEDGSILE